jgi:hypothetical protein
MILRALASNHSAQSQLILKAPHSVAPDKQRICVVYPEVAIAAFFGLNSRDAIHEKAIHRTNRGHDSGWIASSGKLAPLARTGFQRFQRRKTSASPIFPH